MGKFKVAQAVSTWGGEIVPQGGPARRLAVLVLVRSIGFGLFLSSSAIFLHRSVGLTSDQVGLGMSVAGMVGLLFTVPIGSLADRLGAKRPLLWTYGSLTVLFTGYCAVSGFMGFVAVASLISVCETSAESLRMTLTHALFTPEERVRVSAQMRSLSNVGFMLGAALAGAALAVGSRSAFYAVILLTAIAHAVCALITSRLSVSIPAPATALATDRPRSGLKDFKFVSLSLLCGVLELYQPILTVALPLWIVSRTEAPASVNSVLLVLDTLLVIALQVAMSRGADSPLGSARMLRRSGLLLAACCLVFALTQGVPVQTAIPLLLLGTVVLVLGELSQAAGSWGLSLQLPPPGKQGEYQGVFALGRGLQQTIGPFLVTSLAVGQGRLGWIVLAAVLLTAGVLCPPITRSAETSRRSAELAR